ncbi:hypothetical protein PFISCL1PPCAC_19481, partial [Pristionchus fissidentatus]
MWSGAWLLYFFFIDRLIASDPEMIQGEFKDISIRSGRRFAPFKLENSNDQKDRLDRTTTSIPHIALKDWMEQNPNLRKLAMFQSENEVESKFIFQFSKFFANFQIPNAADDNFHHMYMEVNRTLFTQTDRPNEEEMSQIAMSTPRRKMPSGKALTDKTNLAANRIPLTNFNDFSTSTEPVPFEVTEALMRDLTGIGTEAMDTVAVSHRVPPIDNRPPATPVPAPSLPQSGGVSVPPRRPYRIPDTAALRDDFKVERM